ncbi:hypothetical protein [Aureimonas glaciei]|uniref:Uncharacterized protein n=1 Tax=Aureimonas glaciei TaxID=1776957 RepID=A0A917DK20_9HYPH|nr:hypothetical protein [Aureimonas glaciei]GGD43831.1 hypothetical protein GCM10011335_53080 [Aureimonas glaciei]
MSKTVFANCVAAVGLSLAEVAKILGQSLSMVQKKSQGQRAMTQADADALSVLWHRIRQEDVQGLPEGAVSMSHALRVLRGAAGVDAPRRGRPIRVAEPVVDEEDDAEE